MPEAIDLKRLLPDARAFLSELAAQNTRDWFTARKSDYDSYLKRPAEKLLADMARWMEGTQGHAVRTKLFRPHRDVRFSEDKTPYHTHLHMMWSLPDGRAWMLGISPDYATFGAGVMGFEAGQLDRYRAKVAGPEGETLAAMVADRDWRIDPPALKRVPAPYSADHPREALLRHKGLVAWHDGLEDALTADPEALLRAEIEDRAPLMDWLAL